MEKSDNVIKICIFTGTRAEYGLLRVLAKKLDTDKNFELKILVSGSHLCGAYGNTLEEIIGDGFTQIEKVDILTNDEIVNNDIPKIIGRALAKYSDTLKEISPKYIIILGDRYEALGAAIAAHFMNIKIIHIHGGETSLGSQDNKNRNAITQLSDIHFTSAELHANKVKAMVGREAQVINIGPMVIDNIKNIKKISKEEFERKVGFKFNRKNILITYHPVSTKKDNGMKGFLEMMESLKEIIDEDCALLFTSPNADAGGLEMQKTIDIFTSNHPRKAYFVKSLGHHLYINGLMLFDIVLGNSSSGIIEAPLLQADVLNIGQRQEGRHCFGVINNIEDNRSSISNCLRLLLAKESLQ